MSQVLLLLMKKGNGIHLGILAWEILCTEPGRLQSMAPEKSWTQTLAIEQQ